MSSVFYTTFEHLFWHYKLIIYIECASYTAGGTYCGVLVMATLFGLYPFLLKLYADEGYQGPQVKAALRRWDPQLMGSSFCGYPFLLGPNFPIRGRCVRFSTSK